MQLRSSVCLSESAIDESTKFEEEVPIKEVPPKSVRSSVCLSERATDESTKFEEKVPIIKEVPPKSGGGEGDVKKETKQAPLKPSHKDKEAKKLFERFDKNGDGILDVREFQLFALKMGEVWTLEEAGQAITYLDSNNCGGVSFLDFFQWLNSSKVTRGNERLQFLKLKIQSENYLHYCEEIAEEFAKTNVQSATGAAVSTELDINISFGDFKEMKSAVHLMSYTDVEKAREATSMAGGSEGDSVEYVVFNLHPSADMSLVNSLCAELNVALTFGKKLFKYDKGLATIKEGPKQKQLVASVVYSGKKQQKITSLVKELWGNVYFSLNLEFDCSPSDLESEFNTRLSMKGKAPHLIMANAKKAKKIPEVGRSIAETIGSEPFQASLPLVEFAGVELHLGTITEIAKIFANSNLKEGAKEKEYAWSPVLNKWSAVKDLLAWRMMKMPFLKKGTPRKRLLEEYFKAEKLIHSLETIIFSSQQTTFQLNFSNFNIVHLLPSKAYLGFEPPSDTEKVVDDLKVIAFKVPKEADSKSEDEGKDSESGPKAPKGPRAILQNNYLHATFERDDLVVFEHAKPGPFTLNHVILKGSLRSKNPVKHAFFWAFDVLPDLSTDKAPFSFLEEDHIVSKDDDDHLQVKWPPSEPKDGHPFAHIAVPRHTYYGEYCLPKPVTGRFIVCQFADSWEMKRSKDKATVQYVAFIGPAEKPQFASIKTKFGF